MLTIETPFVVKAVDYHDFLELKKLLNMVSKEHDINFKESGFNHGIYEATFFRTSEEQEVKSLIRDANEAQDTIPLDELETYAETIRRKKRSEDRKVEAELYKLENSSKDN